jgi:hypothetical protein
MQISPSSLKLKPLSLSQKSIKIPGTLVSPPWIEHWPCIPRVSGSIPGPGNLKKLSIVVIISFKLRLKVAKP